MRHYFETVLIITSLNIHLENSSRVLFYEKLAKSVCCDTLE